MPVVGVRKAAIIAVLVSLFLLCSMSGIVFASSMMWSQKYGEYYSEVANELVETADGGYAIAGWTKSFGVGSHSINSYWLVKTDNYGNLQWNQSYGGYWEDVAYSLVETSDGGFALTGETNSFGGVGDDFWLVKTDAYGNMQWNQTYGETESDIAYSLVATSDGGYAIAGRTGDASYYGHTNFWLVKTDELGNIPEFPSWTIPVVGVLAVAIVSIIYRQRIRTDRKK